MVKKKIRYWSDKRVLRFVNDYAYLFAEGNYGHSIVPIYIDPAIVDLTRSATPFSSYFKKSIKRKETLKEKAKRMWERIFKPKPFNYAEFEDWEE